MSTRNGNNKHPNDAVVLSGARTPIGKFNGALTAVDAPHLGAVAIKAAVERAGINPSQIEEVLLGQGIAAGSGQARPRPPAVSAGLPNEVGAASVNKACGSGMKAMMLAAQAIRAGDSHLMVAGGMEGMSGAPHLFPLRQGIQYGH